MDKKRNLCPNCGAPVELEKTKGLRCPFCGGNLLKKHERVNSLFWLLSNEVHIVPFETQKEEIINKVTLSLSQKKNIPTDLLNSLSFEVKKIFVPIWKFSFYYRDCR